MNKDEEDELLEKLAKEMMKNSSITSAFDVEEKLRKSFGKIIQSMLEEEMNEHLGREEYEHERTKETDKVSDNYRNGHSRKKVSEKKCQWGRSFLTTLFDIYFSYRLSSNSKFF